MLSMFCALLLFASTFATTEPIVSDIDDSLVDVIQHVAALTNDQELCSLIDNLSEINKEKLLVIIDRCQRALEEKHTFIDDTKEVAEITLILAAYYRAMTHQDVLRYSSPESSIDTAKSIACYADTSTIQPSRIDIFDSNGTPQKHISIQPHDFDTSIALIPTGNGALLTSTQGNARGKQANDLQHTSSATYVASGDFSVISGGQSNTASGSNATIGGGKTNNALNNCSTIGGGNENTASGQNSTIGGGMSNMTSGLQATISGGHSNNATNPGSTVGGGTTNTASGTNSTIGGGSGNTAAGLASTIAGGSVNTVSDLFTTIGGGAGNTASSGSTIAGGTSNVARGSLAVIGGGSSNVATGENSLISGGNSNTASNINSTVSGGINNTASGNSSTVGGGINNTASGSICTIAGGSTNTASNLFTTIGGGIGNTASNTAFIGGGNSNIAIGSAAVIGGGSLNAANGSNSFVGGGLSNKVSAFGANIGGGSSNIVTGSASIIGGGSNNTITGHNAHIGSGLSNHITTSYATISGGFNNQITGTGIFDYSTIGGGSSNQITGAFSTISGGYANLVTNDYGTCGGGHGNWVLGRIATIPGGSNNLAQGLQSFAAGHQAWALADGTFAWSDSNGFPFICNIPNSFNIRASGGVRTFGPIFFNGLGSPATGITLVLNSNNELRPLASSELFKENITNLPDSTWIYDLQGKQFHYIDSDKTDLSFGWIAEDVAKINKDIVIFKDEKPYGIKHPEILPFIVEEMKKGKVRVDNVEKIIALISTIYHTKITSLEKNIDQLRERIQSLEAEKQT